MIEIKDLLSKFTALLSVGEGRVDLIRNIISETIGVQIKKEEIKIKNNIIYLKIKPIYKNEILLKQDKILFKLKEAFKERTPRDIR